MEEKKMKKVKGKKSQNQVKTLDKASPAWQSSIYILYVSVHQIHSRKTQTKKGRLRL